MHVLSTHTQKLSTVIISAKFKTSNTSLQYVNTIYVEVNICMCKILSSVCKYDICRSKYMHVLSTHAHKLRTVIISAKFKTFLTFLFSM